MPLSQFFKHFDLLAGQPDAVARMRELVLQLVAQPQLRRSGLLIETHQPMNQAP